MSIVYLAGPIMNCTDAEAHDWRDDMTKRLEDHQVLSPMARDYRGKEDESVTDIVEGDKKDIDSCDTVIAYCPKPSVGTSMEILYAWQRGHQVIVYAPNGAPVSPWLRYHSHTVHHTPEQVAAAVHQPSGPATYIAGPMSSIGPPSWNYPAFHKMANRFRSAGFAVINPAELHTPDPDRPWHSYLRDDLAALVRCDQIVMLNNWEVSRGATLERHVAKTLGMNIIYEADAEHYLEQR